MAGAGGASEEKCIALCDFQSDRPDELSFRKGDVITVVAKGKDSGFWEGHMTDGRHGLFPNCFVSSNMHPNRGPQFLNKAIATFQYKPNLPTEMGFRKHDLITVLRPGASPGWWVGINESERKRLGEAGQRVPKGEEDALLFPSNYVTCSIVQAAYAFQARQRCELSISPGDIVIVHRRWNDGWWEGSIPIATNNNTTTPPSSSSGYIVGGMRRGIFPSNYTTSNVPTTEPPLFCAKCRTVYAPKSTTCKECARNEEIVRTMMSTLDEFASGQTEPGAPLDLFAHVDIDPAKGRGALLSTLDAREATVRPKLAV